MGVKGCSYKNVTLEKMKVLSEHFLMDGNIWHTAYKVSQTEANQKQ